MRKSRAATPASRTAPQAMKGRPRRRSAPSSTEFSRSRASGPATANLRPVLGDRDHPHVPAPAKAPAGQNSRCAHHLPGGGGRRGHQEMALAEAGGGAVVHHDAVLAQHQAVAHPARLSASRWCWCRPDRESAPRPGPGCRSCRASRHRRPRPLSRTIATSRSQACAPGRSRPGAGNSRGDTRGPPRSSARRARARPGARGGEALRARSPSPCPPAPSAAIETGT